MSQPEGCSRSVDPGEVWSMKYEITPPIPEWGMN
jgi:hypothetical protein